jgi:phosphinothricin acetyltransferase
MSPSLPPDGTPELERTDLRPASDGDATEIARIYNLHVDAGGSTFDTVHWQPAEVLAMIRAPAPEGWYVASRKNAVVGWASVRRYSIRHGYRYTGETAIYLDPAAIGQGVGDLLQNAVERHCRRQGMHHAVAKIASGNRRSLAFHYRHGYELVGIQKEIGHMEGQWVDVAILQRIF